MKIKIEVIADNASECSVVDQGLESVLEALASNPYASEQILDAVTESQSAHVRADVASNPKASMEMLDKLVHDDDRQVRAAVAQHPQAIQYCWKLAMDHDPLVRYCLAMNPSLPEHVYMSLAKDDDERVARRARRTLSKMASQDNPIAQLFGRFGTRKVS